MSATDATVQKSGGGEERPAPPRGTFESILRWSSSLLVLTIGVALLVIPDPQTESDPDLRLVRIGSGAGLILLLLVREMFVWFGSRRP